MYRCEFIFVVADAINQWTRINKITVEGEFVGLRCHAVNFEVENKIWNMELKIQPRHFFLFLNAQEKLKKPVDSTTVHFSWFHTAGVHCAVRSLLLGPNRNGSVSLTKLSIFFLSILFFFFSSLFTTWLILSQWTIKKIQAEKNPNQEKEKRKSTSHLYHFDFFFFKSGLLLRNNYLLSTSKNS